MSKTTNGVLALHIHIATNGDRQEKQRICNAVDISEATLNRILRGGVTRWEVRYRIYQLVGIRLSEEDEFPERTAI